MSEQVLLVTGCRSGFGLLTAVSAARAGWTVYAGLRDVDTASDLVAAADRLPVHPIQLDVVDSEQRQAAVAHVLKAHGRIDGLVNNAGRALGGCLEQIDEDELRALFDVNVFGPFALTNLVLPAMRARRSGCIVNVSSMSGTMALPALGGYAASKFALEGMSEALRHEVRQFGIRVVLIEPGPYKTDIASRNRSAARRAEDPDSPYAELATRFDALVSHTFENRAGDAQDVADRIVTVLGQSKPALRHPMGPGSKVRVWVKRLLPFSVIETVVRRQVG